MICKQLFLISSLHFTCSYLFTSLEDRCLAFNSKFLRDGFLRSCSRASTFDALRLGSSSQIIIGRLLRFWESKKSRSKVNSWESLSSSLTRRRVVVYLSLWEDVASMFRGLISSGDRTQKVMVVTTVNPKIFGAEFICKAWVVDVLQQNGWYFVSCTGCSRKLDKDGTSLRCIRCVNPNATGVIKYRVELLVDDRNDNATFVVFDREILKLTKQDAAGLNLDEIRVTPFNFSSSHRTFTVSAIINTIGPETFKTNAAEFVPVEGGQASATGSNMTGGEEKEPNPSDAGGKGSSRKRPRE
ncbi:hypothetical protein DY000_02054307 [Brassica cretica]|uniref:Replication factor A C-terminal domain-containing protein n=1 Tax=Brassica cretica TaxID=69181 RepID=A0ABQ7AFC0_BRACR|nr:hypothetical protein DY000_02054307 [Brassica cretica]